VTVLAGENTGLAADDVFYYSNMIGESGDNPANAVVDVNDELASRTHKTGFSAATIVNPYDYNRDGKVNATDDLIARHNVSGPELQLIALSVGSPMAAEIGLQPVAMLEENITSESATAAAYIATTTLVKEQAAVLRPALMSAVDNVVENHLLMIMPCSMELPGISVQLQPETVHSSAIQRTADLQDFESASLRRNNGLDNRRATVQDLIHSAVFSYSITRHSLTDEVVADEQAALADIETAYESFLSDKIDKSLIYAIARARSGEK
jgi:hypothetical protein